ncbi:DUF5723 family protein [Hymenobacter metallicola]|uniref:DUF5723 domain-containing protein n=1 Tax=Hymenobacter metallicola TaxID=2563114 RepID=A0A4Z0QBG8_9BACT|nr:DUF5723 family protein [Hymenobacter metallicola]TGE27427.1 hypothetical protein E5K02_13690 [Hymenobacter metallicola]
MINFRLCGLLLTLLPGSLSAQQLFNSTRSNYSGLAGATWNPANIVDNRYFFQLQLVSFDAHATNTAYRYTGPWSPQNSSAQLDLTKEFLTRRESDKPKLFSAGLNVRGPGLMVRISPTQSVAFSTRVRTAVQGNAVSESFIQNAVDKFKSKGRSADNSFNMNLNAFSEYDLTYGRVIIDKSLHFLKAGVTAKRYIGFGSGYLRSDNADYQIIDKTAATGDTIVRINNLNAAFGYSNPDAFDNVDADQVLKWLTGGGPGGGWGADLGVVYEYRPNMGQYRYIDKKGVDRLDYSRNKYLYRVAVSVTDIGYIRYKENATAFNNIKTTKSGVSEADLEGIDIDNYEARLNKILRTDKQVRENEFVAGVPTALNVDVDYHVYKWIYANASVSQNLRGNYAVGMRNFSYASVTPRIESKWLEVATPLSMINGYQTFAYGLMLRLGPLVVGSNDLGAYFDSSSPYGFNGYAELSFALANGGYKKKRGTQRLKDSSSKKEDAAPKK